MECNIPFPQTQNEIIDIIGKRIIQKSIVAEVKQAPFYSILVDEVTSFNCEFMPLCEICRCQQRHKGGVFAVLLTQKSNW